MPPELRNVDGMLFNPGIESSGPPIGFTPEFQYETTILPLTAGTIAILRTDGVDEAMNSASEQFGESRFRECIRTAAHDPESICKSLFAAVQAFAGSEPQKDDITLMAFGREREST